jgi:glycine oxidase
VTTDLVIVGGGVIGLSVAWRARARGLSVVVLDRGPLAGAASHVAAGMLAPVTEADSGELELLALGTRSAAMWPGFAAELEESSGMAVGYRRCGTIAVAGDRDQAEALDRERELRARLGLTVRRLLPSAARRLEPALAPTIRLALEAPDDHAVDPRLACAALAVACERTGVVLRPGVEVAALVVAGGRAGGVELSTGERIAGGQVVVAAGPWSGALPGVPDAARVPVRPVKGQILRLRDPHGPGPLGRVVRFEGGYLVPRGDGRIVLGATMEERGFDTTATALGVHELLRDAAEVVPGILELVVDELSAGLRPATPDNAPAIGASRALDGLVYATGHHRNGVLLAPVTAGLVAAELAGERPRHAFSPDRFAEAGEHARSRDMAPPAPTAPRAGLRLSRR